MLVFDRNHKTQRHLQVVSSFEAFCLPGLFSILSGFLANRPTGTVEQSKALDAMLAETKEKVSKIIEFQVSRIVQNDTKLLVSRSYFSRVNPQSYHGSQSNVRKYSKADRKMIYKAIRRVVKNGLSPHVFHQIRQKGHTTLSHFEIEKMD